MGKASRDKGARAERECVHILQEAGIAATRVPLSGAAGVTDENWSGDVAVPILGYDRRLECKCRARGFKQIYDWLAGNYGLVLRADREKPLICIRLEDFAYLARHADQTRSDREIILTELAHLGQEQDPKSLHEIGEG